MPSWIIVLIFQTKDLIANLGMLFESNVQIPRIKVGKRQTIKTQIREEDLLFAKYLRTEGKGSFSE